MRLLCEGELTEPMYFREFQRTGLRIEFAQTGLDPLGLVRRAKGEIRSSVRDKNFDEIWCVFDHDEHSRLNEAIELARESSIKFSVSNPCFELWLLLHFVDQRAFLSREQARKLCEKRGLIDKKSISEYALGSIAQNYPEAKKRAVWLHNTHVKADAPGCSNPSSSVWKLVDTLL